MKTDTVEAPVISKTPLPAAKPEAKEPPPPPPPPSPLAVCNGLVVEAKRDGREEGERRCMAWMNHRNSAPTIPANATLHEQTALQMGHITKGNQLRSASQNFRPEAFVSGLLDVDANKPVLEAALRQLRDQHADVMRREAAKPAIAAPKKNGLVTLIENALGVPVVEPEPWPPPRPPVRGGPWGVDEPPCIPIELKRISDAVASFPLDKSFEQIVGMMNAVGSAIVALVPPEAKASQPAPFRFTFTPKWG
jgi:hypothetical protein